MPRRSTTVTAPALSKTCSIFSTASLACLAERSSASSVLEPWLCTSTLSVSSETTALALAALNRPAPSHVLLNCLSSIRVNCFNTLSSTFLADSGSNVEVCMTLMTPIATLSSES